MGIIELYYDLNRAVNELCQMCKSKDKQAGIEPVCKADCYWKQYKEKKNSEE